MKREKGKLLSFRLPEDLAGKILSSWINFFSFYISSVSLARTIVSHLSSESPAPSLQCNIWESRNTVLQTHRFISPLTHACRVYQSDEVVYQKAANPFPKQVAAGVSVYQVWGVRTRTSKAACPVAEIGVTFSESQVTFFRAQNGELLV